MLEPLKYLWNIITQQFADQFTIIQEISFYYKEELKERMETRQRMADIKSIMSKAQTYESWKTISQQYDKLGVVQQQINEVYSPYYDYEYLQELLKCLARAREQRDSLRLIQIIRSHSERNIANANCPFLYHHAYNRSKRLIEQYHQELAKDFSTILKADIPQFKKVQFFGEVRHAVGRSALLLSGGGLMGMYHFGVVQALIEADCLPKIIAGSSAGSIVASILATHTRQQLLNNDLVNFNAFLTQKKLTLFDHFRRAGREGAALDIKILENFLKDNLGEYTFQEAYDKFGIILNITVTGSALYDSDRLLNYLTSPNVLIWSASAASCAIPYIYGATDLYCKDSNGNINKYTLMNRKFWDGSICQDLPMNKLSILFNVNNFIVSQTNPWVTPFMDYTEDLRSLRNPLMQPIIFLIHRIKEFFLSETRHRASQAAYIFPNAVTKFLNIFTQTYVGDITIWPKPKISDFLRVLENPTSNKAIMNFVQGGRQRTYPKIHHIKCTMYMEKQIDKCYRLIRNESRLHFLSSQRQIEEAGEEEFVMKKIFQEDKEWEEDEEQSSFPRPQSLTQRRIKKYTNFDFTQENAIKEESSLSTISLKRRNDSYLLPREKSFQ